MMEEEQRHHQQQSSSSMASKSGSEVRGWELDDDVNDPDVDLPTDEDEEDDEFFDAPEDHQQAAGQSVRACLHLQERNFSNNNNQDVECPRPVTFDLWAFFECENDDDDYDEAYYI